MVFLSEENQCTTSKGENSSQSGISVRTTYRPVPSEPFFSHLLILSEVTQECACDVFAQIDGEYHAKSFSTYTECLILSLGKLSFPEMSHVLHFVGSTSECFQYDSLGVPDPALVINSNLKKDILPLGHFLQLQKREDGDDMTVVFGRNQEGFVAILHSVKVSMFGGIFMASARIENNILEISGDTAVFQYPVHLHISAPVNETIWKNMFYTVHGVMDNGTHSFITRLQSEVFRQLNDTATSGISRKSVALKSLTQASERLNEIEYQYNKSIAAVNEANYTYENAVQDLEVADDRFFAAQSVFESASTELQELEVVLDALCTEQVCENTCMRGVVSKICYRPIFIQKRGKCSVIEKKKELVREVLFYRYFRHAKLVIDCYTVRYYSCHWWWCCAGSRQECRWSVRYFSTQEPVYNYRIVEVDVETVKSCTIEEYSSSVPYNCPETSECATVVPNSACVQRNALCRQSRGVALQNVEEAREDIRKPFHNLQEARKNLSVAKTSVTSANTLLDSYTEKMNELFPTLQNLRSAKSVAEKVYRQTVEQIKPMIRVSEILSDNNGMLGKDRKSVV